MSDVRSLIDSIFLCERCGGKGYIRNPCFEYCLTPEGEEELKKMGVCDEDGVRCRCQICPYKQYCDEGEFIFCPDCGGDGYLKLDKERFKQRLQALRLTILPDSVSPSSSGERSLRFPPSPWETQRERAEEG